MIFVENDIDFARIDWRQFEELCFDLLVKYQFHSLVWRQGGGDKGRDIEGMLTTANSIVGPYSEKWFVECKHYSSGIPVEVISTKIDWANAERIQHLLFITNSYLTQNARDWIEKVKISINFRIHFIESKQLKQLILPFDDLIIKYFSDDFALLIRQLLKQWIAHDIIPEPKALLKIRDNIEVDKLSGIEMCFLYYACWSNTELIEKFCEEYDEELFDFDFLLPHIAANTTHNYPVLNSEEIKRFHLSNYFTGRMHTTKTANNDSWAIAHENYAKDKYVQIFMYRNNGRLDCRIATKY